MALDASLPIPRAHHVAIGNTICNSNGMKYRAFWVDRILRLFESRSVVWLSGVRRAGKTVLCRSIPGTEYFDCELPRVRRHLADPEGFLSDVDGKTIVLDEVHRLDNPSELLKIAADHFPRTRVIATGSSTLSASARFRDTLAGRKRELWLTPRRPSPT
jgi:predicted AAA+ superfamily ATPase